MSENYVSPDERIARHLQSIGDKDIQNFLSQYARNFTSLARQGEITSDAQYDRAIERTLNILSTRRRWNPLLVSDSSSKKEAVIAGVAYRITSSQPSETLHNKEIIAFDCEPDEKQRYERQFKILIKYGLNSNKRIIPYLNFVSLLIYPDTYPEITSVATMFRVLVRHGMMQFILAITLQDYQQYLEPDAALDRSFAFTVLD